MTIYDQPHDDDPAEEWVCAECALISTLLVVRPDARCDECGGSLVDPRLVLVA